MYNEAEVEDVHLEFCSDINSKIYIYHARKICNKLFDLYKDTEEDKIYTVTFEDTTPEEDGPNSFTITPKYVFNVRTGGGKTDFVIEVSVILAMVVYKFNMRWKLKKEE